MAKRFNDDDRGTVLRDKLNEFSDDLDAGLQTVGQAVDDANEAKEAAQSAAGTAAADAAGQAVDNVRGEMQGYVSDAQGYATSAHGDAQTAQQARDDAVAVVYEGDASLEPGAGKIPVAHADGTIDLRWLGESAAALLQTGAVRVNDIGVPGHIGFGVGICPVVPDGYSALPGTFSLGSPEYGLYRYSDGSIMAWIPAFYYRVGHPGNPTYPQYGVNSVDVQPFSAFSDAAEASTYGYALHRAFIDGGDIVPGFMRDQFGCSNNGGVASSLPNKPPLSSSATHNPFSELNGSPSNNYAGAIDAAKTRGESFFPASRFMRGALVILSTAHGQAARSTAACAWYDPTGVSNFPKGNNNNAFGDTDDPELSFTTDGFAEGNSALTGSGVPFAKTTHNGQPNGVADLNGNMWSIEIGLTCIASSHSIEALTQTNPVRITVTGHGLTTGEFAQLANIEGPTALNNRIFTVTVIDADTFSLDGVDGTSLPAWESGGSVTTGKFYVAKESTRMEDFTSGASGETDHWGETGVAEMMEEIRIPMRTDYNNNGFVQRFGNGANQVLDESTSGPGWVLTSLGLPMADGASTSGTHLFGQDYCYQRLVNGLCVRSGGHWADGSRAGAWAVYLNSSRSTSLTSTGFAAASYPVRPSGS